jgi:hypothetical protein
VKKKTLLVKYLLRVVKQKVITKKLAMKEKNITSTRSRRRQRTSSSSRGRRNMFSTTASLLLTTIIISATVFMLMMPLPATAFVLPTSSTTLKLVGNQHSATLFALVVASSIILRLCHLCLGEERTFDDHHTPIRLG